MKRFTNLLAVLVTLTLVACGRAPEVQQGSLCAQPVTTASVPGEVSVQMIFGYTTRGQSYLDKVAACSITQILETDLARVRADYSACSIDQVSGGYQVNCFDITDGVHNSASYTGLSDGTNFVDPRTSVKRVGFFWLPPYAQGVEEAH